MHARRILVDVTHWRNVSICVGATHVQRVPLAILEMARSVALKSMHVPPTTEGVTFEPVASKASGAMSLAAIVRLDLRAMARRDVHKWMPVPPTMADAIRWRRVSMSLALPNVDHAHAVIAVRAIRLAPNWMNVRPTMVDVTFVPRVFRGLDAISRAAIALPGLQAMVFQDVWRSMPVRPEMVDVLP
jgi:hypothetical protein